MDKKILDKIKETLDSSYEIQKDIKENEEKINKQEENYNVEKESFDKEFQKENPNNPVYMDRRNSKMNELEKLNKEIQDGKNLVEVKKGELKEKFNKNKEEILKQVETQRNELLERYNENKERLNKERLNKEREYVLKDIEASKRGIESEKIYGNKDVEQNPTLKFMVERLKEKETRLEQINNDINDNSNADLEKEFNELSDVEDILKSPYTTNFLIEGLANIYEPYAAKMKEEKEVGAKEDETKKEEVEQKEPKQNEVKTNEPEEAKKQDEKTNKDEDVKSTPTKQDPEKEKIYNIKYNKMNDLKFERRHNEEANELDKITNVDVKINKKGILEYLIYEEGKKEPTIFSYNSNKFSLSDYKPILKNIRSHIDERQGFEILNKQDRKNIDPFLVDVIGEKIGANKNSDSLDKMIVGELYNNDYIDVKYDMENLKKVKGLRNKMHLREIARGAEKQGFEVENFKDTLLRRMISKIKNRSYELEARKEPKRITEGNKNEKTTLRQKASKIKNKVIYGYVSMDNKVGQKFTDLHGKLKDKISDYKNNKSLRKQEKATKHQKFAQSIKYENPEAQKIVDDWNEKDKQRIAKMVAEIKDKKSKAAKEESQNSKDER